MSPTKSSTSAVLAERSPNTGSPTKATTMDVNGKPSPLLTLQAPPPPAPPRFEPNTGAIVCNNDNQSLSSSNNTYISPSDAIRSPTTKKLSEIKGKRYQNAKPSNLFAKTMAMERFKAHEQKKKLEEGK